MVEKLLPICGFSISALTVLPGIWMIAAPFVLDYSDQMRPTYSDVITGVAVILFAIWSCVTSRNDSSHSDR